MSGAAASPPAVRVFVLHGNRLLAEALERSLADDRRVRLVGTAHHPVAMERLVAARPDVVLIDGSQKRPAALAAIRELDSALPRAEALPFGLNDGEEILDFIETGARGYVPAQASLDELIATIEAVSRKEALCSCRVAAGAVERLRRLTREAAGHRPRGALTAREEEVLELLAQGRSNKEIAATLEVALATVKNHVHSILEKTPARSRREAVQKAYENGWIDRYLPSRAQDSLDPP